MNGLPIEVELIVRLVAASIVGAGVGVEREIHGHPAGLRTHLLVALGSAVFTELSFHGFEGLGGAPVDPTRIAAQVVSGIGFLGAGAILKEGFTIRGLTTAASLWGTAALGMATAVGEYGVAIAGTAIILISLWPLNPLANRLEGTRRATAVVNVEVIRVELVGEVRSLFEQAGIDVSGMRTRRLADGRYATVLEVRHPSAGELYRAIERVAAVSGVQVGEIDQVE